MSDLEDCANAVKKVKNVSVFIKFLEAFKAEEQDHIKKALDPKDPKDFNLRAASLCAEAYGAADLMHRMLTQDK